MSMKTDILAIKALLGVASVTAKFPGGVKEAIPGQSIAKVKLPALYLLALPTADRLDPGSRVSTASVRQYRFTLVAVFSRTQFMDSANIAEAIDALYDALEGNWLPAADIPAQLAIEPVKLHFEGETRILDMDNAFYQYLMSITAGTFYWPA